MILLQKKKKKVFFIKRMLEKRRSFIHSEFLNPKKALKFLNIAQCLGAVNDNVFKFLTVFLLIDIQGIEASSRILFWVGTVYVLPFLLFSSAAGILADKFSKQKIIVVLKGLEVLTTSLAMIAFWLQSPWACYALLFLLSFHSAAFGPPKYSIIPELVPSDKISKANGLITSFTYLGIILGTFLASFTTQITSRNFVLCAGVCVFIALLGFAASLFIPYTKPNRSKTRFHLFFLKEVYSTLSFCYKHPHLLLAVLCAAFFLYLGAFFQLNVIPFAMQALALSEVGGGYLFLTVAIGIALGAILVGKLSKHSIELGFSCLAGLFLFILTCILSTLPKS
ncbi:MAG: MFS transporter, partial [Chlamydiae bacterium]|nr:MFS transporter [Chlamydiota bacterium]